MVHVQNHIGTQIQNLYKHIVKQQCESKHQLLKNAFMIATYQPDQFAYEFMQAPGFMSVLSGEALNIFKCFSVPVWMRYTDECYMELPIIWGKKNCF